MILAKFQFWASLATEQNERLRNAISRISEVSAKGESYLGTPDFVAALQRPT
jgi:hypothetical protein